jgi:hypothetical protein
MGLGHTADAVLDVLNENLVTECCPIVFLSGSDTGGPGHHTFQDLNPCDYSLLGFLKDTFY